MGQYISHEELEDISIDCRGTCNRFRAWINNMCKYIYNDEKKCVQ